MSRLLVSVRSIEEARLAQAGGADLIDIKEPSSGSLGAATPETWRRIASEISGVPLSVALGELLDEETIGRAESLSELPAFRYAKVGLAQCEGVEWIDRWREVEARLPEKTRLVAVAYADHIRAGAPAPSAVLAHALSHRCAAILVDTFDKKYGDLLRFIPVEPLRQFVAAAKEGRVMTVVGGSIGVDTFQPVIDIAPDYIAVRGAVCESDRTGSISLDLVKRLAARMSARLLSGKPKATAP